MRKLLRYCMLFVAAPVLTQCKPGLPEGDKDNGGLMLPNGFDAVVVADSLGAARHMAVNDNGDIYVKLRRSYPDGSNVVLRDENNDGKADIIKKFSVYIDSFNYGTAMRINNGYLYYSSSSDICRVKLKPGEMVPDTTTVQLILRDDFAHDVHGFNHTAKPLTFDDKGNMYVPYGSPSDVCQLLDRTPGSPGQMPCPQLDEHAGVWMFDPNKPNQTIKDGKRYATGIRSAVAITWNPADKTIYVVQHGRDDLHRTWPEKYDKWTSALQPSEEFLRVKEGTNAGWPYYYYDFEQKKKLLNPEYGGDGKIEADGKKFEQPLIGFPGHFAPNDILFYTGNQFPDHYKNGAFIAFHGSTIRGPYSQGGYFVAFVPFKNGQPSGDWEVFADGFSGMDTIVNTSDALHRPMGLAQGPDGSLYISDSKKGTIWRIMYKGDKNKFGAADLTAMATRKATSAHIKDPDPVKDNLQKEMVSGGEKIYKTYCVACHLADGKGDGSRFPPLDRSEYVLGDKNRLINVILHGLQEPVTIKGKTYNNVMPAHNYLSDADIAMLLTYVRKSFGNDASEVLSTEVQAQRYAKEEAK
ncbi:PQQ-dependent sugar dehydrogenase [Panacibacter sp. DH6]|uniref:PQQ-dependent sugar dehydrogenase n=1 Tax=Panacibacter microcysteis TaxID=2793269 RepID=A0A931E3X6_9BACT|nr:c-type cytochrome [Panacibacter microcysteis]MBG9375096.1 PQQ-dependent sugar dehydrogenase [Panacibacter microcysteis]